MNFHILFPNSFCPHQNAVEILFNKITGIKALNGSLRYTIHRVALRHHAGHTCFRIWNYFISFLFVKFFPSLFLSRFQVISHELFMSANDSVSVFSSLIKRSSISFFFSYKTYEFEWINNFSYVDEECALLT